MQTLKVSDELLILLNYVKRGKDHPEDDVLFGDLPRTQAFVRGQISGLEVAYSAAKKIEDGVYIAAG